MDPVQFNFLEKATLSNRTELKGFINSIFKKEKKKLNRLTYVFCNDEYILDINRRFLQHDYYTDIITFDLTEPIGSSIISEIYISVDTVKTNAQLFQSSFKYEFHRVIFHGVLHLCGYGDKTKDQQKKMREREDYYLQQYFG